MKLKEEWSKRISLWLEELQRHFYIELTELEFEGMFTKEYLSYDEAMSHTFLPMPVGKSWGEKWEYGWFRTQITLPKEAEGKRIFLKPEVGGEMIVWVNGVIAGSRDLEHDGITLTKNAVVGEQFTIVTESYAGHGPRLENAGPYPPERIAVPEPPKHQVVVKKSSIGIWNEDAFQLYIDAFTLSRLYQSLDNKSLRTAKILEGLEAFTKIVDFELPLEERTITYQKARKVLQPLLLCVNGSTAPEYTIFGQSHLDLAWKWPWEETKRKCARTISSQLALLDEYKDYKFMICEPPIMENLKENYKEVYERLLEKVKQGQFMPEGGMYVESDTNLPSGESLIRQCIWGKRWFQEELDYDTKMVWLPDCFGFSGQIPQIFIGCGMKYFATQKIARALKGCEVFPYNIFMWEGIDGTQILTHFFKKNNSRFDPFLLNERWSQDRVQQENIDTFLFPFGYGDGGGGATREIIELVKRCEDLEGAPRTKMQSPIAFFENIEAKGLPKEKYVGEIYLAWHRGTYTAQAKTKRGNRKAEIALREAEFWSSLVGAINSKQGSWADGEQKFSEQKFSEQKFFEQKFCELWRKLLFNQFHDILPGTSITRVQEEAERDFTEVIHGAEELCGKTLDYYVTRDDDSLTIFNSLSWSRTELVELPEGFTAAYLLPGVMLPCQKIEDKYYVEISIPSCGYVTIELCDKDTMDKDISIMDMPIDLSMDELLSEDIEDDFFKDEDVQVSVIQKGNETVLENAYLRVQMNEVGQITSIYEKESKIEFAAGLCNDFCMYQDINVDYDAWELSSFYEELPIELSNKASIEILERGPLLAKVRVTRMLNHSKMQQDIILASHSKRVDFKTSIEWEETHKLLKVAFPVKVFTEEAIEEIQFGYVKRPTHRSRRFDADRFEVCNHKYTALAEPNRGFAVLNDCKYGVSTNGNRIELTLLRAPLLPDMYADKGLQEFTYSFYAYEGSFAASDVVRQGYELNVPVVTVKGSAGNQSLFGLSHKGIILETVKPAEDGSGDIILRLYESQKSHTSCNLRVSLPVEELYETDMLEVAKKDIFITSASKNGEENKGFKLTRMDGVMDTTVNLEFRPFEIKTLRLIVS